MDDETVDHVRLLIILADNLATSAVVSLAVNSDKIYTLDILVQTSKTNKPIFRDRDFFF